MRDFAELYDALDATTSTNAKVTAMVAYFKAADPDDAAWVLYFLTGRRFKRLISAAPLREWAVEASGLSPWLFEDCYEAVGDLSETIALVLDEPSGTVTDVPTLSQWVDRLDGLRLYSPEEQKDRIIAWWRELDRREILLLNKLLLGGFRVGVSQTLVEKALAELSGLPRPVIAHRLMGHWEPSAKFFEDLLHPDTQADDHSRPYPFYLAHATTDPGSDLGNIEGWQIEWKWDGIRAQLIKRHGQVFLWSRGEELVTDRFPEIVDAAKASLPDNVALDGEILAWRNGKPLPFSALQTRIGRKIVGKKALAEAPVVFMAYDLLEQNGRDIREVPMAERRYRLDSLLEPINEKQPALRTSQLVLAENWASLARLREESRERGVEGFMLKRLESAYQAGRKKGDWWKWKIDPYTVDAVLIYAQAGHGKRASLYTDYTFAVWDAGQLVPIAKAYSGLTDQEIDRLDNWIRNHTVDKFGPVRSVIPQHVFELHFEAIAPSSRHKSGLAVRFPRIARWRTDKTIEDADSLQYLRELIPEIALRESAAV